MMQQVPGDDVVASAHTLLNDGGPGWLYLLVLLFVWNAFKLPVDRTSQPSTHGRSNRSRAERHARTTGDGGASPGIAGPLVTT